MARSNTAIMQSRLSERKAIQYGGQDCLQLKKTSKDLIDEEQIPLIEVFAVLCKYLGKV